MNSKPFLTNFRWPRCSAMAMIVLSACTAGPDYHRPSAEMPANFKELGDWKVAQPSDHLKRNQWWEVYHDEQLATLESAVSVANQNVRVAEAQLRQARAVIQGARAQYFPTVTSGTSATPSHSANTTTSKFALNVNASWEPDFWGRIRRTVEADTASAQASAADLETVRLLAQTELAQNYFLLRGIDAQRKLFDDTIAGYQRSLQLRKNQYAVGVVAKVDVVQAEAQLKTAQAQAIDLRVQRAQLEHAIAVLVGKPASNFSIAPSPLVLSTIPPPLPVGVPSQLLERRPDVAGAERRIAAANAQIGVANAAFFPAFVMAAGGGFESSSLAKWLSLPSRIWSLGPALAQTLFDAGARRAQSAQAIAAYDGSVAAYRQTVLNGFQEVEDNLAALRILQEEAMVQDDAVKASQQAVTLATNQYKAGTVRYINVITAQSTALNNKRNAVDIMNNPAASCGVSNTLAQVPFVASHGESDPQRLSRRLTASVLLIKALGGGWNAAESISTTGRGN